VLCEIPDILTAGEVKQLKQGFTGLRYTDGRPSGGALAGKIKNNLELLPAAGPWEALAQIVMGALMRSERFIHYTFPRKLTNPLFNRYEEGMGYGTHSDLSIMEMGQPQLATRTDLSFTIFLCEPSRYEGGELVVSSALGESRFKPSAGTMVVYPSGNRHRVETVRRGVRLAAVGWVQSYVKSPQHRAVLFELHQAVEHAREQAEGDDALVQELLGVYHQLIRMWSES